MSFSYIDSVNPNLICCICHAPFIEPVTSRTCTHTFCKACISRALTHSLQCPIDRMPLSYEDLASAGPIIRSLVDELLVQCTNVSQGCDFTCQRQLLSAHIIDSCPFVAVPCPDPECEETLLRKDLREEHGTCVHANTIVCEGCSASINISSSSMHYRECPSQDTTCPDCDSPLKRAELLEHQESCMEYVVNCLHSSNGCPWKGVRSLVSRHLRACDYEPIRGFFSVHNQQVDVLKEENLILKSRVEALEGLVQSFQNEMRAVRSTLRPWMQSAEDPHELSTPRLNTSLETLPPRSINSPYERRSSFGPSTSAFRADTDILSPVSAISTNQDILASYFPPEPQQNDSQASAERRRTPTLQIPRPQPSTRPSHRPSLSLATPIDTSPFIYPNPETYQFAGAPRFGQAPPVPPVVLQGTLEDSLNSLRDTVVNLSATVDNITKNTEMALTSETFRLNEDVMSLRSSVHGLRMQVHGIMVDRHAQASASEHGVGGFGWIPGSGNLPFRSFSGGVASPTSSAPSHGPHSGMPTSTKL